MYCPKCGCEYREGFSTCADCNVDLVLEEPETIENSIYANLFIRICALIIDLAIISIVIVPLLLIFINWISYIDESINPLMITTISGIIEFIPFCLYFSVLESSKFKGSVGKMIFKIVVVDNKGEKLTFKKATIRSFSKIISFIIGLIGIIIAASSDKKLTVHDNIAKTLVIKAGYEDQINNNILS